MKKKKKGLALVSQEVWFLCLSLALFCYCFSSTSLPSSFRTFSFPNYSLHPSSSSSAFLQQQQEERKKRYREEFDHVVVAYDVGEYNLGLKALVNSILKNAKRPERVFFHLIVEPSRLLQATFFLSELETKLPPHSAADLSLFVSWEAVRHLYTSTPTTGASPLSPSSSPTPSPSSSSATRFGNPLNVARMYLERLFPFVEKVVSLDTDQVLLGDVGELASVDLSLHPLASTHSERAKALGEYLNLQHPALKEALWKGEVDVSPKVFGGGLFVANLTGWREGGFLSQIEGWSRAHLQMPLLAQRTLKKTLLNLVFNRRVLSLGDSWNSGNCTTPRHQLHLTFPSPSSPSFNDKTNNTSSGAKVLHFAGFNGKPWDELSSCDLFIKTLWHNYFNSIPFQF